MASEIAGGFFLRDVPVMPIRTFMAAFVNHPLSMLTDPGPVARYIADREDGELARWDVLVAGIKPGEDTRTDTLLGIPVVCQRRTAGKKSDAHTIRVTNKQRVSSRGVEKAGLSHTEIGAAESEYRLTNPTTENYPDIIYRNKRERPLLILHLLHILSDDKKLAHEKPVVAWSVSFPRTNKPEQKVQYVVTTTWMKENSTEEVDEEEQEPAND